MHPFISHISDIISSAKYILDEEYLFDQRYILLISFSILDTFSKFNSLYEGLGDNNKKNFKDFCEEFFFKTDFRNDKKDFNNIIKNINIEEELFNIIVSSEFSSIIYDLRSSITHFLGISKLADSYFFVNEKRIHNEFEDHKITPREIQRKKDPDFKIFVVEYFLILVIFSGKNFLKKLMIELEKDKNTFQKKFNKINKKLKKEGIYGLK